MTTSSSQSKLNKVYYTYVDWTTEEIPRPFYVGKGDDLRIVELKRNQKHNYVANKYGLNRVLVATFENEIDAFNEEIRLIAELHTFINDPLAQSIASNYTTGGEGCAGINERWVEQYDGDVLIKRFKNMRDVAKEFNVKSCVVSNAISGKGVFPMNMRMYTWKAATMLINKSNKQHGNSMIVLELDPVTNLIKNEYESITEALKAANVRYSQLINAIRNGNPSYMNALVRKQVAHGRLKIRHIT